MRMNLYRWIKPLWSVFLRELSLSVGSQSQGGGQVRGFREATNDVEWRYMA
jgi:hypothetical protein